MSRGERHPVATVVACLGAFLLVTTLPVAAWLEAAGVDAAIARALQAASLAVLSLALHGWCMQPVARPWPLFVLGGAALAALCAGPVGAYLSWCAFTGLAEEVLLCGIWYPCLRSQGTDRQALWGAAALFAACHLTGTMAVVWALARLLFAGAFGSCMVWLARRTGRLWVPAVCHGAFDAAFFAVAGW